MESAGQQVSNGDHLRDAPVRCVLCELELDACLCPTAPNDAGDGRRARLNRAELETLEAEEQRLEQLERGRRR